MSVIDFKVYLRDRVSLSRLDKLSVIRYFASGDVESIHVSDKFI